jgi:hypothetical protein
MKAVIALCICVAFGCGKKDDAASGDKGSAAATAKSGLAWTPDNYGAMTAKCKKALACCEEVAKGEGAKSPEDFNGKCSGPALWKDDECETDLKARAASDKPVPDVCK